MSNDPDQDRREHDRARRRRLVEAARCAEARLSVLTLYDTERRPLGYDFGNGQRYAELVRARRAYELAVVEAHRYGYGMGLGDLNASPDQVRAAYREITRAKLGRYARSAHADRTYKLAVVAWRRVADEIERTHQEER